jgi:precorrin-2 dehydrogenase / sirohydrochlorin ferrochelatase
MRWETDVPAPLFPIFIKLEGRDCLVVGAGSVAEGKIASLLEAGAKVTVVAPDAIQPIRDLAAAKSIRWTRRSFLPSDLDARFLAIAATSNAYVNHRVFLEAQQRGILCNAVDDPPNCDFYFPAVVRRGDLQIAVSTSGQSPALAQRIRRELEQSLDASVGDWVAGIGQERRKILASQAPSESRKRLLHDLAQGRITPIAGAKS